MKTEYTLQDKMRDLIDDNNLILLVLSRFGIQFGFGDSTIAEVCRENNVDCPTFMAVANLIAGKNYTEYSVSLPALMEYLKKAHTYFSNFILPEIRRKLIEALNCNDVNDVAFLILKFYDDYTVEVENHMKHENDVIFTYVEKLLHGQPTGRFNIAKYSVAHDNGSQKLKELKDIAGEIAAVLIQHRDSYIAARKETVRQNPDSKAGGLFALPTDEAALGRTLKLVETMLKSL